MNIKLLIPAFWLFAHSAECSGAAPAPVRARHAMVVSAHAAASEVGLDILRRGGNAVDAAVAVGFALAVVYPEAGNLGGGGFMLIRKSSGEAAFLDFRETAPRAASRSMYLDSAGNQTGRSVDGDLAAGVPGSVAGLLTALRDYGSMPPASVLQPAIELAEKGFIVDRRMAGNLRDYGTRLRQFPGTLAAFSRSGDWVAEGDTLRQPELARTLRRILQDGIKGFYEGETARLIVEEMQRGGGLITEADLNNYRVMVRQPLHGRYRDSEFLSAPPPSSGGICLSEALNILDGYDLRSLGFHSSRSVYLIAEAMKRAFADRAEYLGDPEFTNVPTERLISSDYAAALRSSIDSARATPSELLGHPDLRPHEGPHTTHYVVVDAGGMIVSTTTTLNDAYGNKVVVPGAGFFLNDEMDDFSVKPGVPNLYGLVGGDANAIAGGKRPLSSMAPTIVLRDGRPVLVLGARGGSRIITSILQTVINVVDYGMNVQEAVDAPRFHHQWLPDTLDCEQYGFPLDVRQHLAERAENVRESPGGFGAVEAIFFDWKDGWIEGASDSREGGTAIGY